MSLALLFHYLLLNMFQMLVHPSSGACDLLWIYFMCCIALVRCVLVLRCGSAGVVWNNKASDIKLVYLYSTIKMMHGPINWRIYDRSRLTDFHSRYLRVGFTIPGSTRYNTIQYKYEIRNFYFRVTSREQSMQFR